VREVGLNEAGENEQMLILYCPSDNPAVSIASHYFGLQFENRPRLFYREYANQPDVRWFARAGAAQTIECAV